MRFREFESIETHFFLENFREREAQNARDRSEQDASVNMLRQTVTLATAIFLLSLQDSYQLRNVHVQKLVSKQQG